MEFILDFLVYPIVFIFDLISAFLTVNCFTFISFISVSLIIYKYYVMNSSKLIKYLFLTILFCLLLTSLSFILFDNSITKIISFVVYPFEIISIFWIIIEKVKEVIIKRREKEVF